MLHTILGWGTGSEWLPLNTPATKNYFKLIYVDLDILSAMESGGENREVGQVDEVCANQDDMEIFFSYLHEKSLPLN